MNIRASGRSALIIAAGLWLGFAGPMRATESAAEPAGQAAQTEKAGTPVKLSKFSKHRSHQARKHVAHAQKSAKAASKAVEKTAANAPDTDKQLPLPPAVANANARMPGVTDAPRTEADALASSAGKTLAANQADPATPQGEAAPAAAAATDVVPSDELNDVDRALSENKQATPTLAMASVDTPVSATSDAAATGQSAAADDSTWRQTSLIGKIFIAFGGLLTLASAARMFIA